MDKPLSQERLSEIELQRIEKLYEGETKWAADPDDVKLLLIEVKRLQAIEAERDRYKVALQHAGRIIDSGMGAGILRYDPVQWFIDTREMRNGADTNE